MITSWRKRTCSVLCWQAHLRPPYGSVWQTPTWRWATLPEHGTSSPCSAVHPTANPVTSTCSPKPTFFVRNIKTRRRSLLSRRPPTLLAKINQPSRRCFREELTKDCESLLEQASFQISPC